MVLSDLTIRHEIKQGRIVVTPLQPQDIQPASIDLHLDREFIVFVNSQLPYIDTRKPQHDITKTITVANDRPFILHPDEFVLAGTAEHIEIPDDIVARLEGKSSLGRLGLLIHSTAGFIDPGWQGRLTLELTNVARLPIALYAGMKIGQISFLQLTTPAIRPYGTPELGSKYQGDAHPTPSRYAQTQS